MKKIIGILSLVLLMALMLGTVLGTSATAAEEAAASDKADETWVVSANVAYKDNIYPYFAIDASLADNTALLEVKITEEDGTTDIYVPSFADVDIYGDGSMICHVVVGPGVAAKDMADALSIEIIYNGETVENISYSVAQYFYERLYNNGFINAEGAEDIARRELYLSSLAYGAAAQDLLSSSDELLLYDALYIDGPCAGVPTLNNKNKLVTLDEGKWKVYSFMADGSIITSYVTGGIFLVENPAIIRPYVYTPYDIPASAETFEDISEEQITYQSFTNAAEGSPTYTSINTITGGKVKVEITTNDNIKGSASLKTEENGNTYLNIDKEGKYSGSSANLVTNLTYTGTFTDGEDKVFETRLRTSSPIQGSGKYYFRLYDRSKNQLCMLSFSIQHYATTTKLSTVFESYNSEEGKNVTTYSQSVVKNVGANEWMTLRVVVHSNNDIDVYASDADGELDYAYTIPHEVYRVYKKDAKTEEKTYDKLYSSFVMVRMFQDSTWTHETDLDNIYLGGELPFTKSMLTEENFTFSDKTQYNAIKYADFEDKNGNGEYDSNDGTQTLVTHNALYPDGSSVPGFKGTTYTYKDILTNKTMFTVIDTKKNGGNSGKCTEYNAINYDVGNCDLYFYSTGTPSENANTVVFELDIFVCALDNGSLTDSESYFNTIYYKDNTSTKVFQSYFGKQSVSLNGKTSTGYIKKSTYTYNEWNKLRYEYTTIGLDTADTSDDYFRSRVYVNGVLAVECFEWFDADTSNASNPVYNAATINIIRIQPSKSFIGKFAVRNVSISYEAQTKS